MLFGFNQAIRSPGLNDPFQQYWVLVEDPLYKPKWFTPKTELVGKLYQLYQIAYKMNLPINILDECFKLYFTEALKVEELQQKEFSEF